MVDASPGGNTQPAGMGSAMLPMLFLLLMMMSLMMFPSIRNSLSDGSGAILEPFLFVDDLRVLGDAGVMVKV